MLRRKEQKASSSGAATPDAPLDTSFLLNKLISDYRRDKKAIELDFRGVVHWIRMGERLTHNIHPYPAKLLPHIAHFFTHARSYLPPSDVVLDPFSGSGTVALEASIAGYRPYVADANPLALLISKVKTTNYEAGDLKNELNYILATSKTNPKKLRISIINRSLWYYESIALLLDELSASIEHACAPEFKPFFDICFSDLSRRLSLADPSISVPVRLREKDRLSVDRNSKIRKRLEWLKTADVYEQFSNVCQRNINRVEAANRVSPRRLSAFEVGINARELWATCPHAL